MPARLDCVVLLVFLAAESPVRGQLFGSSPQRDIVAGKRLRIVAARQGERLEHLSARTGNAWSPGYTAIANGLDVAGVLREGQVIKIARTESVRP